MRSVSSKRRPAWLCFAAIATLATTIAVHSAHAADRDGQLTVGGKSRTFSLHIPDAPPPQGGFPVVLAFHGGGGQGANMRRLTGFDAVADRRGFIVVYPDGIDKHWNDGRSTIRNPQDDIGFVNALLDHLQATAPVDRSRVFATGASNGALFAERLGCDLAARIGAIAPVAGTLPADIAPACKPARPVAVLQIDGTADPIMPYDGGKVADFGGRGEGGVVLSVAATAAVWANRNGCKASATEIPLRPIAPLDPTRIVQQTFGGCAVAAPVKVLSVQGGGHTWPGGSQRRPVMLVGRTSRQTDASEAIADFFLGLPRR
jgi:polyhydroxybutyrate depolymerase